MSSKLPLLAVAIAFVIGQNSSSSFASQTNKPNVIIILADDLGWAELGCYGNRFNETPNLDKLASEGLRFTDAYAAAPVCSPDRAAILTGKWPARVGITDYLRPNDPKHLDPATLTLAELLKKEGYATGIIGKWHLTGYAHHGAIEIGPDKQGFDEVICSERRGIGGGSYFWPYHFNPDIKPRLPKEHLVDRLNLEAVEFIRRHAKEPFFLYLSHYAVHTRLAGRPDLVAHYESKENAGKGPQARRNNPHLAAQLECIDNGVGQIRELLGELKIDRRTFVIFTSDNGGEDRVTTNGPLRSGKSTLYEGGIRVPLIFWWPGRIQPGICHQPVCAVDLLPTIAEATGVKIPPGETVDGISLVRLFENPDAQLPTRCLFWHYPLEKPHFLGGRSAGAIRCGQWKLIQFFDTGQVELYNLAKDISEQTNLVRQQPNVARRLYNRLQQWRNEVGAQFPPGQPKPAQLP